MCWDRRAYLYRREAFILLFIYHVVFLREIGKGLVIKNAAKMGKIQECHIFPISFLTITSKISDFRVLMQLNWIKLRPKIILNYQESFWYQGLADLSSFQLRKS